MARIPTISAQNIAAPPGTAGGVLLGKTGTSNIEIKTPLTEQLNPAQFGQEGAAMAKGANQILRQWYFPMVRQRVANKKFTEYADTSMEVNMGIMGLATEIASGRVTVDELGRPRDINAEINQGIANWSKTIESGISDARYRSAYKATFANKIATLKIQAANALQTNSNKRVEAKYKENIYNKIPEFKLPTRQGNIVQNPNWELRLAELDTLDNGLENSGLDPLTKLKLRDEGHLQVFNEVVERLKFSDPKMGLDFMHSDQVKRLLEGTSTGNEALRKAKDDFRTTITSQMEYEDKLAKEQDEHDEKAAQDLVDTIYPFLEDQIAKGKDPRMTPMWLDSTWKPHFRNADRMDDYKTLKDYALQSTWQVGETKPETLFNVQKQIWDGEYNINDLPSNLEISNPDKKALQKFHKGWKDGDWLLKNPQFILAKKAFEKMINIPPHKTNSTARQMGAVAMGLMIDKVSESLDKGQEWSKQNDDWPVFFKNLMDEYGTLHDHPDMTHTQTYLRSLNSDLPPSLQNFKFPGAVQNTFLYDWQGMAVEAHKMVQQGKLKGDQLRDVYNTIDNFKSIISLDRLTSERARVAAAISSGEIKEGFKYFKFTEKPEVPERIPAPEPKPIPEAGPTKRPEPKPIDPKFLPPEEPQLKLGAWTGRVTTEGRKEYTNNLGGTSTEFTIGVTNPQINNGQLTHIPSIYNGILVSREDAEKIIINNGGKDPETGRFITPGGDPEERSKNIKFAPQTQPEEPRQTEMFPNITPDTPAAEINLAARGIEDLNEIKNFIIDFAEGKTLYHLKDTDSNSSGIYLTNQGIARKIWTAVPIDLRDNPSDEMLKKLFDQYKIPYKED